MRTAVAPVTLVFWAVIVSAVSFTSTSWPRNEVFARDTLQSGRNGRSPDRFYRRRIVASLFVAPGAIVR